MRQMLSPKQMVTLSPIAKKKLDKWLKDKEYGTVIDGEFLPVTQLTIGQMLQFLVDNKVTFNLTANPEILDELWAVVKNVLEEKN